MARERDYLYRRGDRWWVRFQHPNEPEERRSLKTRSRAEAEIIAAPLIAKHRVGILLKNAHRMGKVQVTALPVGVGEMNGRSYFATSTDIYFTDNAGKVTETIPNSFAIADFRQPSPEERRTLAAVRPKKPAEDDAILETWISQRGISGYLEREARATYAKFQELVPGKPLAKCSRDDGRKLVAYFKGMGNKQASIQKKVDTFVRL